MKKTTFPIVLASMIALSITRYAAAAPPTSILFVETAASATLTATTLTLNGVSTQTLWFTDRPKRGYGHISTGSFINNWNVNNNPTGFKNVAPNAATVDMTLQTDKLEQVDTKVIALKQPVYNAIKKTLTFQIQYLNAKKIPRDTLHIQDVSLFIDPLVFNGAGPLCSPMGIGPGCYSEVAAAPPPPPVHGF